MKRTIDIHVNKEVMTDDINQHIKRHSRITYYMLAEEIDAKK